MTGFLGEGYFWVKAVHIIFVIFWMAGMFMLPRFFAYHMEADSESDEAARWVEREARLLKIIINPSMILTWIFGLMLAAHLGAALGTWFLLKFILVFLLSGFHGYLSAWRKKIAGGDRSKSTKFWRLVNEIPGVAIIAIVLLAVAKPF